MAFRATETAFPEILKTERFCLRPMGGGDLPDIVRQLSDERIAPWLAAVPHPFGLADAEDLLTHGHQPGEHLRVLDIGGDLAGCICLGSALWYWLDPEHWRQGLMQSALTMAMAAYFAGPSAPLLATCRSDNSASRALLVRLGFAQCLGSRRMFFQGAGTSETCTDYLMAPEQWHLIHPPRFGVGSAILRPAVQKDCPILARMLPKGQISPWPKVEGLPQFVETHRFRGEAKGLFVLDDENRRSVGMALLPTASAPALCFLSDDEERRHGDALKLALAQGLFNLDCV